MVFTIALKNSGSSPDVLRQITLLGNAAPASSQYICYRALQQRLRNSPNTYVILAFKASDVVVSAVHSRSLKYRPH